MEAQVTIAYSGYTDTNSGKHGIRIVVTNVGDVVIEDIQVNFCYEYEKPISHELSRRRLPPIRIQELGGSLGFCLASKQQNKEINSGESLVFLFPIEVMPLLKTLIEALPNDKYRIVSTLNGKEETAIPGDVLGEFVKRLFPDVETVSLSTVFADPRIINPDPVLASQGRPSDAYDGGIILSWRIRYLDSLDKQFKDRDLWLDTAKLDPINKAAIELWNETKDSTRERDVLRFRHLFQKREHSDAEWHELMLSCGKMSGFCLHNYFEDENGNELSPKQMAVNLTGNPDAMMFSSGMRQHDVDYIRAEPHPIPLGHIQIPADSLEILGYFVRDFREMESTAFYREGAGTLKSSTIDDTKLKTAVTDEEIRSFVTIFRRLCITNERADFWKVVKIFNIYASAYPLGRWVKCAGKQYRVDINSVPRNNPFFGSGTFPLTRKELFEVYFYTQYMHQPNTRREKQFQECLVAVNNRSPLLTWLFLTELWFCGHQMACAGRIIADFYDRYCQCHQISPHVLKSIAVSNPGIGALEKKDEQRWRVFQIKRKELAQSLWIANGRPDGGSEVFLDQATEQLSALIDI